LLQRASPDIERRAVSIADVLTTIGEAMRVRVAAAGVLLRLDIATGLPHVTANEAQLELALLNLVTNALDAMRDGGTLTITADRTPQGARIEIRDTGSGISAKVLPNIFEPWVTTKASGQGTGLGLSITRDVVQSIGGTISVTTTDASGTTFTIDLPGVHALTYES
jgi:signal transduction histidine kinase